MSSNVKNPVLLFQILLFSKHMIGMRYYIKMVTVLGGYHNFMHHTIELPVK